MNRAKLRWDDEDEFPFPYKKEYGDEMDYFRKWYELVKRADGSIGLEDVANFYLYVTGCEELLDVSLGSLGGYAITPEQAELLEKILGVTVETFLEMAHSGRRLRVLVVEEDSIVSDSKNTFPFN